MPAKLTPPQYRALHELWSETAPGEWDGDAPKYEDDEEIRYLSSGGEEARSLEELEEMGYAEQPEGGEWRITRKGEMRLLDPRGLLVEEVHER